MERSGDRENTKLDAAEGSQTTIEIKIKTLDSQTYTLRVDKQMPVPALKAQIASVTGVLSEQQRLICRGKVLKDDQLLSAYHVEDGHTLHLVVRQPIPPSVEGVPSPTGANQSSSTRISPSVVIETFTVPDHGDGVPTEIGRIVSAILGSIGITNLGSSTEGRSERSSAGGSFLDSVQQQFESAGLRGLSNAFGLPTSISVGQPPVIPDSLTTMSQFMSHIRSEFDNFGRGSGNISQASASPGNGGGNSNFMPNTGAIREGLPTAASLAELVMSTRRLLTEQVAECLQLFAGQLENQANFTDPSTRSSTQSSAMRIGMLFHYLGAYILELGRTAMTLRLAQSPAESVVNAGPAVYISPVGPNPLMVQPFPFQMGTGIGNIPVGTVQPSSSLGGGIGTGFLPRRIDIQIRRAQGSQTAAPNTNREEHGDRQQPRSASVDSTAPGNPLAQPSSRPSEGLTQPFAGESGVRVVPIRTMVAAVPATFSRMHSDSLSDSPSVRVQASVSRATNNNNSPSSGEPQNNQESGRPVPNSVYQFLRSLFPEGEIHVEEEPTIGVGAIPYNAEPVARSNLAPDAREAEPGATDDGIFLSNLLHQIMPIISQHVTPADSSSARDRDSSFLAGGSSEAGTSRQHRDTDSSPPNSKRQKRE